MSEKTQDIDYRPKQAFKQVHRVQQNDFKEAGIFLKSYVFQIAFKLIFCTIVVLKLVINMTKDNLRNSFLMNWNCKIFGYTYGCSIPSNGLNMIIFDIVNVVLGFITIFGIYNIYWHWQFRGVKDLILDETPQNGFKHPY